MPSYREKLANEDFLKIVCVGDVQTSQLYCRPNWTDWLQRVLLETGEIQTSWRRQLINTAISRATPKHVFSYFTQYVGQFKPDVTLLSFGVSPMYPDFVEKNFSADLDALLDMFEKQQLPVVLWSPYPLLAGVHREVTLTLGAMYKQKAIARGLQFIDLYHDFDEIELTRIFTYKVAIKNDLFEQVIGGVDGVTLNEIGQYIVAKRIALDLLKLPLPTTDVGNFISANLDMVKKWA